MKILVDKGPSVLDREANRLDKMLEGTSISDNDRSFFTIRRNIIDSFRVSIPKIVHFFKTDWKPDHFTLLAYLAIKSALYHIKPDQVFLHSFVTPRGKYWDKIKNQITLDIVPPHQDLRLNGHEVRLAAHFSDVLRTEQIFKTGGIYLDLDAFALKSWDPLLFYPAVMAAEIPVDQYNEAIGSSVFAAKNGSSFIKKWRMGMDTAFDGEFCYACATITLTRDIALEFPEEVNILHPHRFFYPGWEEHAYKKLFEEDDPNLSDFKNSFALHLFGSHANFAKYKNRITEEEIRSVDCNFNRLMRPLLDD
jgi:hypothetical protein